MNFTSYIAVLGSVLLLSACGKSEPPPVSRDAVLPAAKVQPIFEGNTIDVWQARGGANYKVFLANNGQVVAAIGEERRKGVWKVQGDGRLCIRWEGKPEQCRLVAGADKGKYILADDNLKPVWIVQGIQPGPPSMK